MRQAGQSITAVARAVGISRNTVRSILAIHQRTGRVDPGKSTGRPRISTDRQDRLLFNMCRRGRFRTAASMRTEWRTVLNRGVSRQTVNRRLVRRGYFARRPIRKRILTVRNKVVRLRHARRYRNLTPLHWRHVVFADESRYVLHPVDGRMRVRRLAGERLNDDCIAGTVAQGGGSVHVWAAFHAGGKSDLVVLNRNVNAVRYVNTLRQSLLPWARAYFRDNFRLQHDNAPAHRARLVENFLQQEQVQLMYQPPYSPDLNPIENLWDSLQRGINSRDVPPQNLQELAVALREEWQALPVQTLEHLVNSMPRRLLSVQRARGGHTKY